MFVAVAETEEPLPPQLRNALLTVVLLGFLLTATLVVLDAVIPQGEYRLLAAGLIVAALGITLALAASFWTREPVPWKHRFIPQTYTDIALPRTISFLGAEVPPGQRFVIQERLVSATWMRELLTERIMLARGLTPTQLGAALDKPNEAEFLEGKTSLRRFLVDTRDIAVASKGSVLMMSRKDYLKTVEAALKEAETL
jgi:uncharacterized membrane protein YqjE